MSCYVSCTWQEWNANPYDIMLTWLTLYVNANDVMLGMLDTYTHAWQTSLSISGTPKVSDMAGIHASQGNILEK